MVNYWLKLKQFVTPEKCLLCWSSHNIELETGLCQHCKNDLPWLEKACPRCALPLHQHKHHDVEMCGQCQKEQPPFTRSYCLFHYQPPIDQLISRFKFNQQLSYSRLFGYLLAERITALYPSDSLPDVMIPVPLHRKRLQERGFNQAQEIARYCALKTGIPVKTDYCRRDKHTQHQLGLSALERRRNLKDAFSCKPLPKNCRVALVDDVMTTGATLKALTLSLQQSGCAEVHLWCIARAHGL